MLVEKSFENSILIVDDEPMARTLLRLMLVRAGFNVVEAEDGYEALAKMRHEKPDAIILDVMMPGMDGFAVCDEIIRDKRLKDIPIIMLSAKTDIESRRRGLSAGAARYLIKPIAPDVLTQHVHEILNGIVPSEVSFESAPIPSDG